MGHTHFMIINGTGKIKDRRSIGFHKGKIGDLFMIGPDISFNQVMNDCHSVRDMKTDGILLSGFYP